MKKLIVVLALLLPVMSFGQKLRFSAKLDTNQIEGLTAFVANNETAATADTLPPIAWGLVDTVIVAANNMPGWIVPFDITILEVGGYVDANTTTINLEIRAEATPNTSGTDVLAADIVLDTNKQSTTTIANASADKDEWLTPAVSATGDVAVGTFYFLYKRR